MKYSDYTTEQFVDSDIYREVAKKLISLAKDDETKRKMKRYII